MGRKAATQEEIKKRFEEEGFEVTKAEDQQSLRVKKYHCSNRIRPDSSGLWTPAGPSRFEIHGLDCELEDGGYQKFWYADGRRFPARLEDLRNLHSFDQEVRFVLGLKSLYHESLGSTSARSVYDRLEGRPDK